MITDPKAQVAGRLRSRAWFDNPNDPANMAIYLAGVYCESA